MTSRPFRVYFATLTPSWRSPSSQYHFLSTLNFLFSFRNHMRRRGHPYPPGPKPSPIIGNLLDSPKQSQWTAYAERSKKLSIQNSQIDNPFMNHLFREDKEILSAFHASWVSISILVRDLLRATGGNRQVQYTCVDCRHPSVEPFLPVAIMSQIDRR